MKKIETWQCDKCGRTYYNPEDCKECEKRHLVPIAYIFQYKANGTYRSETENDMYPPRILAKFKDGAVRAYEIGLTSVFDKDENFDAF